MRIFVGIYIYKDGKYRNYIGLLMKDGMREIELQS